MASAQYELIVRLKANVLLLGAGVDSDGQPLSTAKRAQLEADIAADIALLEAHISDAQFPTWPVKR